MMVWDIGDYTCTTQLDRDYFVSRYYKDPVMNQSGFYAMSQGFRTVHEWHLKNE